MFHVMCAPVLLSTPALIKSPGPFKYSIRLKLVGAHVINRRTCWGCKTDQWFPCQHHCVQITVVRGWNVHSISWCLCITAQRQVCAAGLCTCHRSVCGSCTSRNQPVCEVIPEWLQGCLVHFCICIFYKAEKAHLQPVCVFTIEFRKWLLSLSEAWPFRLFGNVNMWLTLTSFRLKYHSCQNGLVFVFVMSQICCFCPQFCVVPSCPLTWP